MEKTPKINAIAAIGENRELGKNSDLIWKLAEDFKRMKELVSGKPLIMGRNTYESIGRELPYSPSIVITSNTDYKSPFINSTQTHIVHSLNEAVQKAGELNDDEAFIFGGARVYEDAMPLIDTLYLTRVLARDDAADTHFPEFEHHFPNKVIHDQIEEDGVPYQWEDYSK